MKKTLPSFACRSLWCDRSRKRAHRPSSSSTQTRKVDHVDTYHGTKVPDPYRWLEDDTSAETAAWVEAQNKVTFAYLEKIPFRDQLLEARQGAEQLREVLGAVAEGAVLLLPQERRPAEPERALHPEGDGRHARGADRSQHLVGGRHRALADVRAVEGREVRRLRRLAQRLRLAGIQGHGAGDEEDAARHGRVGEGLGRRPGTATASTTAAIRRREGARRRRRSTRTTRSTSTRSARRSRRTCWSTRTRTTRSASTSSTRPRTSGSRS